MRILSADFVAGTAGAPVAREEYRASLAVAADGQKASLWTVRRPGGWQVVNIATGDDEIRYARAGARKLPGGLVFREPQIDAWYVQKGTTVLPLDEDAVTALGWIERDYVRHLTTRAEEWLEVAPTWPAGWSDHLGLRDHAVLVTREQLAALQAELDEVLQRYRRVGQGNPSAKRIAVYGFAYPVDLDNVPVREA